jgi:hypothetical protein
MNVDGIPASLMVKGSKMPMRQPTPSRPQESAVPHLQEQAQSPVPPSGNVGTVINEKA